MGSMADKNTWLLDDKFMVFRTTLSEQRMDKVIQSIQLDGEPITDIGRLDIAMIFQPNPDDFEQVGVVVDEIKKKTDNEKDNQYAINQRLDRAVKLVTHRKNVQRIWYYAILQVLFYNKTSLPFPSNNHHKKPLA